MVVTPCYSKTFIQSDIKIFLFLCLNNSSLQTVPVLIRVSLTFSLFVIFLFKSIPLDVFVNHKLTLLLILVLRLIFYVFSNVEDQPILFFLISNNIPSNIFLTLLV